MAIEFMDILFWVGLVILIGFVLVFILPGIALVGDSQVGIVTRKMFGKPLPEGHIIATKGEVGVQASTLMPGLYWRFPLIWKIEKADVTKIPPGSIGVVEAVDGIQIPSGRLLGDEVQSDNYQDAKMFLENNGYKGVQVGILNPGTYRINRKVFNIKQTNATEVPKEKIGIVIALDGLSLPATHIVAPAPIGDHKHFQNAQAFLNNKGYRGAQLETLQPGVYYINPLLFNITAADIAIVPPGYVAVIVSSVGEELERVTEPAPKIAQPGSLDHPPVTAREIVLVTDKNQRGILKDPVAPGKYNLNTIAYRAELVPTSAVTIKWGTEEPAGDTKVMNVEGGLASQKATEFYGYSQLRSTSKDGFQLDVDVKLIIRIPPENAPYVISRFGTVHNLIEQVVHPLIDSLFRNEAGNQPAMQFMHGRSALQEKAFLQAQQEFAKYHVEVQGLLIAYIKLDQALLDTQTKKEIAVQQKEQYAQEAAAQEQRIVVQEKTARADKQKDVIAAVLGINIAENEAAAAVKRAEGVKQSQILEADGKAYEAEKVGRATAEAYQAQTDVLGKEKVAALKLMEVIAEKGVIITPKVAVNGGGSNDGANSNLIFNTFLATMLEKNEPDTTKKVQVQK
jgi:regulator of protease activity HflC (stomatin/prohibitin superfamily)